MNSTITNDSVPLPVPQAHHNFIMGEKKYSCRFITKLNRTEWCDFSKETGSCSDILQLLNYVQWISCSDLSVEVGITILCFVSTILMLLAYSNARSYAPNMIAVLYYLDIEEYNAGSIFVNIVNNIPHILLWLNYGTERTTNLIISDLIGAGLAYLFFTGIFFVFYPLQIPYKRFCKRDLIYQFIMICYVLFTCLGEFNFIHAYVWLIVHLLYLVICSLENFLVSVFNTVPRKTKVLDDSTMERVSTVSIPEPLPVDLTEARQIGAVQLMRIRPAENQQDGLVLLGTENVFLIRDFFRILNPTKHMAFLNRFGKALYCAVVPFRLIIKLCVPMVDLRERKQGWSKLLSSVNVLLSTILIKYAFCLPLHAYIYKLLVPAVFVSLVIFATSEAHVPPKYHHVLALYGICIAWVISLIIYKEMFAINNAIRVFSGWDRATANFSIIAWGLTVEGFIINFTFASMKFKYLACGAFLNAPVMFTALEISMKVITHALSFGIYKGKVNDGAMNGTGICFMLIGTSAMSIIALLTNFEFRRSVGVFFIIFYIVFLIFLYLSMYEIIHPYAVNHYPFTEHRQSVSWA